MNRVRRLFKIALVLGVMIAIQAASTVSQQDFVNAVTALAAFLLPLALQLAPASWRGPGMAVAAHICSAVLALLDLIFTGQLVPFDPATAAVRVVAFVGLTQLFYSLFKDTWHLADPPGAGPAPHTVIST